MPLPALLVPASHQEHGSSVQRGASHDTNADPNASAPDRTVAARVAAERPICVRRARRWNIRHGPRASRAEGSTREHRKTRIDERRESLDTRIGIVVEWRGGRQKIQREFLNHIVWDICNRESGDVLELLRCIVRL